MSPCTPYVSPDGKVVGFLCGHGGYTHLILACCPWCCLGDDETVHAFREVYGGYCAPDLLCGDCGQYWTAEMGRLKRMAEDERDENIQKVQALRDSGIEPGPMPSPSALGDCP